MTQNKKQNTQPEVVETNSTNTVKTTLTEVTINFESAKRKESIKLADLPTSTIDFMLQGATRKFNDWVNSKAADLRKTGLAVDYDKLINDCLNQITNGWESKARAASEDKAFRDFVLNHLKTACGISAKTFENVKGSTVAVILQTAYPEKQPAQVALGVEKYRALYDATKAQAMQLDF